MQLSPSVHCPEGYLKEWSEICTWSWHSSAKTCWVAPYPWDKQLNKVSKPPRICPRPTPSVPSSFTAFALHCSHTGLLWIPTAHSVLLRSLGFSYPFPLLFSFLPFSWLTHCSAFKIQLTHSFKHSTNICQACPQVWLDTESTNVDRWWALGLTVRFAQSSGYLNTNFQATLLVQILWHRASSLNFKINKHSLGDSVTCEWGSEFKSQYKVANQITLYTLRKMKLLSGEQFMP